MKQISEWELGRQQARIDYLIEAGRISQDVVDLIYSGKFRIKRLPKLTKLKYLSQKKLLKVIRLCPESPFFCKDKG